MPVEDLAQIISPQNADEQIKKMFDFYEIDFEDYEEIEVNGNKASIVFEAAKKKLIKAIRKGKIEIDYDDNGELVIAQHLKCKYKTLTEIQYKAVSGKAKVAMAKFDNQNSQIYALLAAMAGIEVSQIHALKGPDLSIAECLGGLFLLA